MPELTYRRHGFRIHIGATRNGGTTLRFGNRWVRLDPGAEENRDPEWWSSDTNPVFGNPSVREWWAEQDRVAGESRRWRFSSRYEEFLPVIELVVSPERASAPWEELLRPLARTTSWLTSAAWVRTSEAPSRAANWPLVLPLRILQVGDDPPDLPGPLRQRIGWSRRSQDLILRTGSCTAETVDRWWTSSAWPSIDILELSPPEWADPCRAVSTADPREPWTLGWLERLCHDHRVRLVVLAPGTPAAADTARALGRRLTDRGGPALLVIEPPATAWLPIVYSYIVHDRPLDWMVGPGRTWEPGGDGRLPFALAAGQGRVDDLRVSRTFRPAVDLARRLTDRAEIGPADATRLTIFAERHSGQSFDRTLTAWRAAATGLVARWDSASFDLHEQDGVLPMELVVRDLRDSLRVPAMTPVGPVQGGARYVTPRLFQDDADGTAVAVPQHGGGLRPRRPVTVRSPKRSPAPATSGASGTSSRSRPPVPPRR
ncbi:hypothetical protein [Actinoplanes sp. NPDC089786]|uniref:hypothetical protein n=1 Tax=Actinoplanes sp. NPDC089786 TaxID=3155185 RepID=UPI00342C619A